MTSSLEIDGCCIKIGISKLLLLQSKFADDCVPGKMAVDLPIFLVEHLENNCKDKK